jgi:hypothetical protein
MDTEIWIGVEGFPAYEVSNLGRVRSWTTRGRRSASGEQARAEHPTLLRISWRGGYGCVGLRLPNGGPTKHLRVSRLVCAAFHVAPPDPDSQARHLNDDLHDNRAENLAWGDWYDNWSDRARNGANTLTREDAEQIRACKDEGVSPDEVGAAFGVGGAMVRAIWRRDRWA